MTSSDTAAVTYQEEYGDWVIDMKPSRATPMHLHNKTSKWRVHYTVTADFKCRDCNASLPPGVRFRVLFLNFGKS